MRSIRILALLFLSGTLAAQQPQQPPAPTPAILENYKPMTADRLKAPEDGEWPVVTCSSYEEACRVREAHRRHARDCVIRYIGTSGGGD